MPMSTLYHSVPVKASPEKVYAAVATQAGMQGWWTHDTKMTPKVGGKAEFGFDDRQMVFRMTIEEMTPHRSIKMRCAGDHPDWEGTSLEWVVKPTADGSGLRFYHRGLRDITPFMAGCNSMWGNLMFRIKAFVETGKPSPQWTK
jgi:uncharacterized protein YndB with AHSA1/START domain